MKRRFALACLALAICGVFAAGCDTRSTSPGSSPAPDWADQRSESAPTVTLADPLARNALLQNEAYYAGLTATAVVQNGIATQSALLQMTETARQASMRGTALAVEVQATATAAHLALQQQQAQISLAATATVSAQRQADTLATQLAADVEARRLQMQERARAEAWAELDRQTGFVVRAGLSALAVIALAVLIYHGARWLSVIIAIDARRRLVMERAGLVFDHQAGRWELLPGQRSGLNRSPDVAPAESGCDDALNPKPGWLAKLEAKRAERTPPAFAPPDPIAEERRRREEWTAVCRWFLLWSAIPARDGKPTTLSLRRMQSTTRWVTGQKLTRTDWEKCCDVLLRLGVIEPEPGGSYVVKGGAAPAGRRAVCGAPAVGARAPDWAGSAEAACHFPVWATSWPVPDDVQLPKIVEPPPLARLDDADSGVTSPAQYSTAHTDTHTPAQLHRPAQPETPPEFEILGVYASRVATGASNPIATSTKKGEET